MKLSELVFYQPIYPRGLSLRDKNQVKPSVENVARITDGLVQGKISHKITFNTKTNHIVDGTHLWIAMREKYGNDYAIPEQYLNAITIRPEEEMLYAVAYNCKHGLVLSRADMKAALAEHVDEKTGRMKYGDLRRVAELWGIPYNTLAQWVEDIKHGARPISGSAQNSSDKNLSGEDVVEVKKELEQAMAENKRLKDERDEFKIRWESICPNHRNAISTCRACGK